MPEPAAPVAGGSTEKEAPQREARSIRANTRSQLGPLFLSYGLSFLSVPIVVAGIGLSNFGVWAITGALAQYGALLDLGVSRAVSRFIALYEAKKDRHAQGEVMVIALLSLLGVGVVLSLLGAAGAGLLASALDRPDVGEIRWVLLCGVWLLTLLLLARAVGAYATGRERMDAPNFAYMLNGVFVFAAAMTAIAVAPRLTVFATANVLGAVAGLIAMVVIITRREGRIPLAWPSVPRVREVFGFGLKAQVVMICDLIVFESDKILIGAFVSPAAAGAYEIGSRLAMAARNVSIMSLGAQLAPLTVDITKRGTAAVHDRYYHLTRRTVAVGFPPLVLAAMSASTFLVLWLQDVPKYTEAAAVVISLATIANVSTGVASTVASAAGRPGITATSSTITAALNLVLSVVLGLTFGVWGILAATAIATVVGAWVGLELVHRWFGLSFATFLRTITRPLAFSFLASLPAGGFVLLGADGRVEAGVFLALSAILFAAIYVPLALRAGDLPPLRQGGKVKSKADENAA